MQPKQALIVLYRTKTPCNIDEIVIYATYIGKTKLLLLTTLLVEPEIICTQNTFLVFPSYSWLAPA